MSKAVNYDSLFKQFGDPYEAADAAMYYTNVLCRIRRSAYIDGAYKMSEMLAKGDELVLTAEPNSKVDEWDISVSVKKNGKTQKLGYLCSYLARKIKTEKYTAEVFAPFSLEDQNFGNFGLQILLKMKAE